MRVHLASIATIAFCAISVACGGDGGGTPTSPSSPARPSIPAASIQFEGDASLTACIQRSATTRCDFEDTGRNVGPGCATMVRGTVRFLSGETEVTSQRWTLAGTRVLMPGEQFGYSVVVSGSPEMLSSVTSYRREAMWANTPC